MTSKRNKTFIAGWIISLLLAALFAGPSGLGKLTEWEGKAEMLQKMGFTADLMFKIGVLEISLAVLYLIPRTAFIGAVLLTAYLGGAVVTHLRVGEPVLMPIGIGILVWVALCMRQPGVFPVALGKGQKIR